MPWSRSFFLLLLPAVLSAQQVTFATYQGGSADESAAAIAHDSLGNIYLAGATTSTNFPVPSTAGGGFVAKLDPSGNRLASILIPGGVAITAIAMDSSNNIVVTGSMQAGALAPTTGAYSTPGAFGFVSKLNPTLSQTLWTSTFPAGPEALAIDSSGIYVTGYATNGLVTTPGAYQATNHAATGIVNVNAFVLKLSADGTNPLYATYLGGSGGDVASAIAVDAAGNVYLTGSTLSNDFPLTATAAQSKFGGVVGEYPDTLYGDAFVAKLDAKGASLLYSTYLGGTAADEGYAITVDASGNFYVAGGTASATWLAGPATDTFQTGYAGPPPVTDTAYPDGDAFLAKFAANGTLAWYTYLGGSGDDGATAVALDNLGDIYLAGNTASTDFPSAGNPVYDCHIGGRPFLAEFNSSGAKLLVTTGLPGMGYDQVYGMTLDATRNMVYLAGQAASQVFFATPGAAQTTFGGGDWDAFAAAVNPSGHTALAASCVLNSASFIAGNSSPFPTGAVAPGETVSLFGVGLGPNPPAELQQTAAGTVATSIGGMTVLFDGLPAPLLYAANGQLNAVVPYGINTTVTNMTVESPGSKAGPIPMPANPAAPGVFMCGAPCNDVSQALVLNSDGSLNTAANPAARGDWIEFFVCGVGPMSDTTDGSLTPGMPPYATPAQQVTVTIRGVTAQTLYVGATPGYVNGLIQINAYVPASIDFGSHVPLAVTVGNYSSQANVTLAVK